MNVENLTVDIDTKDAIIALRELEEAAIKAEKALRSLGFVLKTDDDS